ncbi:transposase%2C IS30 family [Neisseria meningitidis]|nr:transposase%2C IS30 family [Neisseria meningitidis]
MSYTQLTQGERYHIQYLFRHCTVTEIAKQLKPFFSISFRADRPGFPLSWE